MNKKNSKQDNKYYDEINEMRMSIQKHEFLESKKIC